MLSSTSRHEVGYLTYGPDAANVLYHVVNDRYLRKRPMLFTTNKTLREWGRVLHDDDLARAIVDCALERGRLITLDGPSQRTRHPEIDPFEDPELQPARISGKRRPGFPEPTGFRERQPHSHCQWSRTFPVQRTLSTARLVATRVRRYAATLRSDTGRREEPMLHVRLRPWLVIPALLAVPAWVGCPRGTPQPPEASRAVPTGVSLALASATAERGDDGDVLVRCAAVLHNDTGRELTVRTNFYSVFDGLTLVLLRPDGAELARQAYNHHQSPYAEDRAIPLPPGTTTEELVFPLSGLPAGLDGVQVRLEGGLPGTEFPDGLRSDPVPLETLPPRG